MYIHIICSDMQYLTSFSVQLLMHLGVQQMQPAVTYLPTKHVYVCGGGLRQWRRTYSIIQLVDPVHL